MTGSLQAGTARDELQSGARMMSWEDHSERPLNFSDQECERSQTGPGLLIRTFIAPDAGCE